MSALSNDRSVALGLLEWKRLQSAMRSGARRLGIVLILGACLAAPVLEIFDRWDQMLPTGTDTETTLFVVALCFAAVIVTSWVIPQSAWPAARFAVAPASRSARSVQLTLTPPTLNIRGSTVFRV
jgi:hypothetical protein